MEALEHPVGRSASCRISYAHATTWGRVSYTEVHHIVPLAEGGQDTIDNVACLCPTHHREVHLGVRAVELTNYLKDLRHDPIVTLNSMTNAAYHTLTTDDFSIFQDF